MTWLQLHFFAYIDPGSGSLLFQLILASFLSVITFSKRVKFFVTSHFKRVFKLEKRDAD